MFNAGCRPGCSAERHRAGRHCITTRLIKAPSFEIYDAMTRRQNVPWPDYSTCTFTDDGSLPVTYRGKAPKEHTVSGMTANYRRHSPRKTSRTRRRDALRRTEAGSEAEQANAGHHTGASQVSPHVRHSDTSAARRLKCVIRKRHGFARRPVSALGLQSAFTHLVMAWPASVTRHPKTHHNGQQH